MLTIPSFIQQLNQLNHAVMTKSRSQISLQAIEQELFTDLYDEFLWRALFDFDSIDHVTIFKQKKLAGHILSSRWFVNF